MQRFWMQSNTQKYPNATNDIISIPCRNKYRFNYAYSICLVLPAIREGQLYVQITNSRTSREIISKDRGDCPKKAWESSSFVREYFPADP